MLAQLELSLDSTQDIVISNLLEVKDPWSACRSEALTCGYPPHLSLLLFMDAPQAAPFVFLTSHFPFLWEKKNHTHSKRIRIRFSWQIRELTLLDFPV